MSASTTFHLSPEWEELSSRPWMDEHERAKAYNHPDYKASEAWRFVVSRRENATAQLSNDDEPARPHMAKYRIQVKPSPTGPTLEEEYAEQQKTIHAEFNADGGISVTDRRTKEELEALAERSQVQEGVEVLPGGVLRYNAGAS